MRTSARQYLTLGLIVLAWCAGTVHADDHPLSGWQFQIGADRDVRRPLEGGLENDFKETHPKCGPPGLRNPDKCQGHAGYYPHDWWATQKMVLAQVEDTTEVPVYIDADSVGTRVPQPALTRPSGVNVRDEVRERNARPFYKGPTGALLKSVVFPGWGQYANRKYIKAGVIFAAESYCIFKALQWRSRTNDRLDVYNQTKDLDDWNNYDDARGNRDTFYWLVAGTIFISMWDAYADAHFKPYEKVKDDPEFWGERLKAPRPAGEISATVLSFRY